MKIWGTAGLLTVLAAGCAAPASPASSAEGPGDGKEMVDRLRVERPSYRPMQNGVAPLSVYIEAQPTYYPPLLCRDYRWGYRAVKWADCGYRYGSPYSCRRDCARRW